MFQYNFHNLQILGKRFCLQHTRRYETCFYAYAACSILCRRSFMNRLVLSSKEFKTGRVYGTLSHRVNEFVYTHSLTVSFSFSFKVLFQRVWAFFHHTNSKVNNKIKYKINSKYFNAITSTSFYSQVRISIGSVCRIKYQLKDCEASFPRHTRK